jgi:putative hemolysin
MAVLIALPALFLLSAFFSGAETVLFSLTGAQRERIRAKSAAADALITKSLADKAVLFSTLLVGNTLVNFAISTLGFLAFRAYVPGGSWLAVPSMTLLLLVFGEITPKRLALRYAEQLAPPCVRLLRFWRFVLRPFNNVLRLSSKAFAPALERERRALSDEELMTVLESAAEKDESLAEDVEMIEGVLRLSEIHANDEMTPRVDIEGLDLDLPEDAQAAALANAKHHFLPVFRRTPDAIEAVLDVRSGKREEPIFVPENITLDDLFAIFAKSGKRLAVVLDEYGGTAGIIAFNDVLELIMGPKVFGGNAGDEPAIVKKGENVWEIDARASLEEVNRDLDLELEAEDADRLSGWVTFHAERIPHVGQEIEADGCRATVLKRRGRRVTLVKFEVLSRPTTTSDEELIEETDAAVERTEEDDA